MRTLLLLGLASPLVAQVEARLVADRDNTLYQSDDGSVSNGVGELVFAGTTGIGHQRSAVVRFDLGSIPEGATITGAELRMVVSQLAPFAKEGTLSVHRMLDDWGEGASNAVVESGKGAPAAAGDATWLHRYYPHQFWAQPGGDFFPVASAEARTGTEPGPIKWSSSQLAADVQAWVDRTRPNDGWVIRAAELLPKWTARGFDSRESVTPKKRPRLTVEYTLPCEAEVSCVARNAGAISLTSCSCWASVADITLTDVPPGEFALLMTGQGAGMIPNPPGASGVLCLGGAPVGRFVEDIGVTASDGFSVNVLDALTDGGAGKVPTLGGNFCLPPGSTWRFQFHHGAFGGSLSPVLEVTFH